MKEVERAKRATAAAFIGSGFAFASWAARIPQVRDQLHLTPARLGLLLLAIAVGSVTALPLAGPAVARFGSRRTVRLMAALLAASFVVTGIGVHVGVPLTAAGLVLDGVAIGGWDVAMNVQAALVEQRLGRSVMPRMHAGYSLGTVAGAALGAGLVAAGIPVTVHLIGVAVIVAAAVPALAGAFLTDAQVGREPGSTPSLGLPASPVRSPWRERRTLTLGVIVLCFAFAEGAGNDWIGVTLIDGYHAGPATAGVGYAAFLAAMTAGRWAGGRWLDRYGRVRSIRVLAALAAIGVGLTATGWSTVSAAVGIACWGLGICLGFPVGMSAGADDPARAAARIGVTSSIGYVAFLAGPPVVGLLGQHLTVTHAVAVVAAGMLLAGVLAGALAPLTPPAR